MNSDIQGTGAVILGGFINAARHSASASGKELRDQRIVFMGAGSAGVGVAKQLLSFFINLGLSEEEAKERVWLVDTKVCYLPIFVLCMNMGLIKPTCSWVETLLGIGNP
jgi:malic enzyme